MSKFKYVAQLHIFKIVSLTINSVSLRLLLFIYLPPKNLSITYYFYIYHLQCYHPGLCSRRIMVNSFGICKLYCFCPKTNVNTFLKWIILKVCYVNIFCRVCAIDDMSTSKTYSLRLNMFNLYRTRKMYGHFLQNVNRLVHIQSAVTCGAQGLHFAKYFLGVSNSSPKLVRIKYQFIC